ncbi:hypothetical protein DS884_15275 [Tenacibaculum sp. E3R01]|nr:hypothetical protein DS884_15275 [Tenacibaculum sp. E3R01]
MVLLGLGKSKKSNNFSKQKSVKRYTFHKVINIFKKTKNGFVRQKNYCIFAHAFSRRNFTKARHNLKKIF